MPMLTNKMWERILALSPSECFLFDRPIVMLQSDDWGRIGLRDRDGFDELQAAGILLGERPYDFYTLETAEDVRALSSLLARHRDAAGPPPRVVMNFITAHLDFSQISHYTSQPPFHSPADGFLNGNEQAAGIGQAVSLFARAFSTVPRSACAPGYRANTETNRHWSQYGIRCAQNGPSTPTSPHLDRHGVLQIYRAVEF